MNLRKNRCFYVVAFFIIILLHSFIFLGRAHSCDKCDYVATRADSLREHKESSIECNFYDHFETLNFYQKGYF